MENIKLVIWDLDETFWKGTLSEEMITIPQDHISIVKEITSRGIMNSICSKNDYETAKAELIKVGVWDYFIFPHINWKPKGKEVNNIISECQLRPENVLFIDDNIVNRKEVEFYNPGISTSSEDIIKEIIQMPELRGKDDDHHTRLHQYKILEKKQEARESYSDNYQFLRDSKIRISFIHDIHSYKERIFELINRTNQLNFTKVRLDNEELDALLMNPNLDNVCIHVEDKYGDYGICGFYSYDEKKRALIHFLFSCRVLSLGIENYIYQKLNCPSISIINPVASILEKHIRIDWIEEVVEHKAKQTKDGKRKRILILGGCDLMQMCHYIDQTRFDLIKEFNYSNRANVVIHKEHTAFLKDTYFCKDSEKKEIYELPFGDKDMFNTLLFSDNYDVLVYSVLMNYTQIVYKRKNSDYRVARGGYRELNKTPGWCYSDEKGKQQIWQSEGQQSPGDFVSDLEWLIRTVKKPIIFINGAEVPDINNEEAEACKRHQLMNNILDDFVKKHSDRCSLIDIRKFARDKSNFTNNIRHYKRVVYLQMAENLMSVINGADVHALFSKKVLDWFRWLYIDFKMQIKSFVS